jgi:tRNA pseudouridine38-40 synthase
MSELSLVELKKLPLYRLDVAYIGTKFPGFQCQSGGVAIQDNIEHALSVFLRQKTKVMGASRTDTGVHAEGQVATFRTAQEFDEHTWLRALNALTDPDIGIRRVQSVPSGFHPTYGAKGKAYRYRIWQGNCRSPFMLPFVWEVIPKINIDLLVQAAAVLVGEHDFTSFCNADSSAKTRVRQIFEIFIDSRGPLIDVWVVGNGFLKQMVRIIVGTLVEIATGKMPSDSLLGVLQAKNRGAAGITAPAQGLTLVEIFYEQIPGVSHLIEKARGGFTMFHG